MQIKLKELIQQAITGVVEDMQNWNDTILNYFSPSYTQHVDGKTISYQQFIDHMHLQKSVLTKAKVHFEYLVEEGNKVCSVHTVEASKKDGHQVKVRVFALFIIENDKIVLCDELTHLIEGSREDRDLGSRH